MHVVTGNRELQLEISAFDWAQWKRHLILAEPGTELLCLASEAHSVDAPILASLYERALQVHNKPDWDLEKYLERFDSWERVFLAMREDICVGYTYARADPEKARTARHAS